MNPRTKKYLSIIGIVIVLIIIALPKLTFQKEGKNNSAKVSKTSALPVTAYLIKGSKLEEKIFSTGNILANEEVELRSEISGKIEKIFFKEGSQVKKGMLLVKINDAELQAALLKANYQKKLAEQREYRQQQMLQKEAISQEEYDISLNELNTINADIQLIKAQLNKTELRAPFDGVIGLKSVSEGSYISSATQIANLQNINPVKVDFSVPEKYYNVVKPGNTISFKMQGVDKSYTGKIFAIEPKIEASTRTLKMRAISNNDKLEIFPGSFAEVQLTLNEIQDAIMIPTEALIPGIKGQSVFIVKKGKATPALVEVGTRTEKSIQVTNGLNQEDTLITSGLLQIRPGMPVKISELKTQI